MNAGSGSSNGTIGHGLNAADPECNYKLYDTI